MKPSRRRSILGARRDPRPRGRTPTFPSWRRRLHCRRLSARVGGRAGRPRLARLRGPCCLYNIRHTRGRVILPRASLPCTFGMAMSRNSLTILWWEHVLNLYITIEKVREDIVDIPRREDVNPHERVRIWRGNEPNRHSHSTLSGSSSARYRAGFGIKTAVKPAGLHRPRTHLSSSSATCLTAMAGPYTLPMPKP